jgi:hypothetical protein
LNLIHYRRCVPLLVSHGKVQVRGSGLPLAASSSLDISQIIRETLDDETLEHHPPAGESSTFLSTRETIRVCQLVVAPLRISSISRM